ncbi:MAG: polysaccharide biosynthesis C-terminal domain-containing protein, partial [Lachnospiraceae bacterium]|nr:polysaccharide biosynthesis C-terminal domain-containing protein [Lachnospiraceae bacterium]
SPTILLFGFLGVLRGYFQARRTMVPTSVSQIIEQIINAVVSILAAWIFIQLAGAAPGTTERAVQGAIGSAVGTGAGVLAALLFMILVYMRKRRETLSRIAKDTEHPADPMPAVFRTLFLTVTPFILSTFIYNFSTMLDQTIFQRILFHVRQVREEDIAVAYGIFSTKAVVIANIPIALSNALSSAMMPGLSARFARKDREGAADLVNRSLTATVLISIPCAAGLAVLSRSVVFVLFPQRASLDEAAMLLAGIAVTVVFYSISTVTNAVLQGAGRMNLPVINAAVALVIQGALLAVLLLCTEMDNGALAIAAILYSGLMCVLNERSLRGVLERRAAWGKILKAPLLSAAIMAICAFAIDRGLLAVFSFFPIGEYLKNLLALFPTILLSIEIYGITLIRFGGVTEETLLSLPRGTSIVRFMKKLRILR